ncbi:MAG: formyltransferase family protein [Anaerolineaceae bacterium]|nr:formyltransferase family protein [Anaerolineaceae bacterium]
MPDKRIGIITNGNFFARLILDRVIHQYHDQVISIIVVTGDYKGRTGINALWELSRSMGLSYFTYKCFVAGVFLILRKLNPKKLLSVEKFANIYNLDTINTPSIKSEEITEYIQSLKLDLIVSVSCPQLIGRKILSSTQLGGINIHSSLLPSYAGLAPYYWVLSKGEGITGTSVHFMTVKFDQGNILLQRKLKIEPGESAFHLFTRLSLLGSEVLPEAIKCVFNGGQGFAQDLSKYSYYSNPTFSSYFDLKRAKHCMIKISDIFELVRVISNNSKSFFESM